MRFKGVDIVILSLYVVVVLSLISCSIKQYSAVVV